MSELTTDGNPLGALMLPGANVTDMISEALNGSSVEMSMLDTVRIPKEGSQWKLETIDGTTLKDEITGVVVYHHFPRAYWAKEFGKGEKTPPDCRSKKGDFGEGNPGGSCKNCPMNQWESDPKGGGGKACKEMAWLYMLMGDGLLPTIVRLAPTSMKGWKAFALKLAGHGGIHGNIVGISLVEKTNKGGIDYNEAKFRRIAPLDQDQAPVVAKYVELAKDWFETIDIQADDMAA